MSRSRLEGWPEGWSKKTKQINSPIHKSEVNGRIIPTTCDSSTTKNIACSRLIEKSFPTVPFYRIWLLDWLLPSGNGHRWTKIHSVSAETANFRFIYGQLRNPDESDTKVYLFRVLPVPDPAYYLRLLQKRAAAFVWGSLNPRVPRSTLYLPKLCGGLGFPNFATYYKAAQLASLPKFHVIHESLLWVVIESVNCDPISVSNLLWLRSTYHLNLHNPITRHFVSLWNINQEVAALNPPKWRLYSTDQYDSENCVKRY